MKKKKEMTIEDLAVITKKGFDGVDKRIDGVDKRIDGVDKRIDGIENKVDGLKTEMNERFDRIENIMIARHDREIELLRDRILQIETKLVRAKI